MITLNSIGVYFGKQVLFDDVTFLIREQDRIGLVGRNGAGKSTLLNVLKGIQTPESGSVTIPKGTKIGYLPQEVEAVLGRTVIEEARTAFDEINTLQDRLTKLHEELAATDDYESKTYLDLLEETSTLQHRLDLMGERNVPGELEKVLKGLGFEQEELEKQVSELSGGWQMRVELAKILLSQPDLLLLDEPTNHLDIESIQWLEVFLKSFQGAVMLVTHDRKFLDNVTQRTLEIGLGKVEDYNAPYSKYMQMREERMAQQLAGKKNQEREIKQIEENIERFRAKASKAKFAQSLIKKLERMERIEVDTQDDAKMNIRFTIQQESGKKVMKAEHIQKSYGDLEVIKDYSLEIARGQRIAFVGKNGMGKSTLAKILAGVLDHEGERVVGHNVNIGYYAQYQSDTIQGDNNVLEQLEQNAGGNPMEINLRGLLGMFLFSGDDIYKKVKVLSGGEKSRLALATLLLRPSNFLIMDEPTNHLDMVSKNLLKQALLKFQGTLLVVSHDRDFLEGLTTQVLEFTSDGIKTHLGDVKEFLEKKQVDDMRELARKEVVAKEEKPKGNSDNKLNYQAKKQLHKDLRKARNRISRLEEQIEAREETIKDMEAKLADKDQFAKLQNNQDFFTQYEGEKEALENEHKEWEGAVEELSKLEKSEQGS